MVSRHSGPKGRNDCSRGREPTEPSPQRRAPKMAAQPDRSVAPLGLSHLVALSGGSRPRLPSFRPVGAQSAPLELGLAGTFDARALRA